MSLLSFHNFGMYGNDFNQRASGEYIGQLSCEDPYDTRKPSVLWLKNKKKKTITYKDKS